jgi:hypothetical protein
MDTAGGECVIGSGCELEEEDGEEEEEDGEEEEEDDEDEEGGGADGKEGGRTRKPRDDILTEEERELGVGVGDADKCTLHATGFEEFLARTYFAEWASFVKSPLRGRSPEPEPQELPQALTDYLVQVFSEKGRATA